MIDDLFSQCVSASDEAQRQELKPCAAQPESESYDERFDERLCELAYSGVEFTSEDVTRVVGFPSGCSNSIVGALMANAQRRQKIAPVGYRKALRSNQHGAILRVWCGWQFVKGD